MTCTFAANALARESLIVILHNGRVIEDVGQTSGPRMMSEMTITTNSCSSILPEKCLNSHA